MELRQLRYFMAVVEAGSFTAAAAELHMSQPPLSLAIAKLETELGVKLLTRSARGTQPTSAGRYLLDAGSRILGEVEDTIASLERFGAGAAGTLTIAAVPVLMWHRIPELLRHHSEKYPDVDVRLVDPPPWTAIDMVLDRKVDVAFIVVADAERLAEQYKGSLQIVPWNDVPLAAAFPPGMDDLPDPVDLSHFNDKVFVLPRRTLALTSISEMVEETFWKHEIRPTSIRNVETVQTCIPLVEAGLATTIVPDADGQSLKRYNLTVRRIKQDVPPMKAIAVLRANLEPNHTLMRLLQRIHSDRIAEDAEHLPD